jgi:putative glycosyltransferase (TIGR04372 family)
VIPEALRAGLAERLTSLGVSRKRWVVGIHTRHNSSCRDYHPINYVRDVDTTQFVRLADYVIDELGGQVVWMGHPSMAVPTKRPGVIDLSAEPMDVQYYATAVSRYFVGCDSGPAMVSAAFKVPTLKSNSMYDSGAWNPGDIMLPKNILTADGRVVSQTWRWLRRHVHWLTPVARARDFVILDNTFEQLRFCVEILLGRPTA